MLSFWPSLSLLAFFLVLFLECRAVAGRVTIPLGGFMAFIVYGAVGASLISLLIQQIPFLQFAAVANAQGRPVWPAAWLIGPPVEELAKIVPILLLAFATPAWRRLSIADLTLAGFATGLGFGFVEANLDALATGRLPEFSHVFLFGYRSAGSAAGDYAVYFAGHAVYPALFALAAAIGLRLYPVKPAVAWIPAAVVFLICCFDHGMYNWKILHPVSAPGESFQNAGTVLEIFYLVTAHGQLEIWFLPFALVVGQLVEARLCGAILGRRGDLLLPYEFGRWVVNEWAVALMRLPYGCSMFDQTLTFFRRRRAFALATLEVNRNPANRTLAQYTRLLEQRLLQECALLAAPPRGTWFPPRAALERNLKIWAWRMRWVLGFSVLFVPLFMFGAKAYPAWLRGFLFGDIFTLIVVEAGLCFAAWRVYGFLRSAKLDPVASEGAAYAEHHMRILLLGAAFASGVSPALSILFGWKAVAPGAAYLSGYFAGWIGQGGNLHSMMGLGAMGGAIEAEPGPVGGALRDEIDAGDADIRKLERQIQKKITQAIPGQGDAQARLNLDELVALIQRLDAERDMQGHRVRALEACERQDAESRVQNFAAAIEAVQLEFERLRAEFDAAAEVERKRLGAFESGFNRYVAPVERELDAYDEAQARLIERLTDFWRPKRDIGWALRLAQYTDESALPLLLHYLPDIERFAERAAGEEAEILREGIARLRGQAQAFARPEELAPQEVPVSEPETPATPQDAVAIPEEAAAPVAEPVVDIVSEPAPTETIAAAPVDPLLEPAAEPAPVVAEAPLIDAPAVEITPPAEPVAETASPATPPVDIADVPAALEPTIAAVAASVAIVDAAAPAAPSPPPEAEFAAEVILEDAPKPAAEEFYGAVAESDMPHADAAPVAAPEPEPAPQLAPLASLPAPKPVLALSAPPDAEIEEPAPPIPDVIALPAPEPAQPVAEIATPVEPAPQDAKPEPAKTAKPWEALNDMLRAIKDDLYDQFSVSKPAKRTEPAWPPLKPQAEPEAPPPAPEPEPEDLRADWTAPTLEALRPEDYPDIELPKVAPLSIIAPGYVLDDPHTEDERRGGAPHTFDADIPEKPATPHAFAHDGDEGWHAPLKDFTDLTRHRPHIERSAAREPDILPDRDLPVVQDKTPVAAYHPASTALPLPKVAPFEPDLPAVQDKTPVAAYHPVSTALPLPKIVPFEPDLPVVQDKTPVAAYHPVSTAPPLPKAPPIEPELPAVEDKTPVAAYRPASTALPKKAEPPKPAALSPVVIEDTDLDVIFADLRDTPALPPAPKPEAKKPEPQKPQPRPAETKAAPPKTAEPLPPAPKAEAKPSVYEDVGKDIGQILAQLQKIDPARAKAPEKAPEPNPKPEAAQAAPAKPQPVAPQQPAPPPVPPQAAKSTPPSTESPKAPAASPPAAPAPLAAQPVPPAAPKSEPAPTPAPAAAKQSPPAPAIPPAPAKPAAAPAPIAAKQTPPPAPVEEEDEYDEDDPAEDPFAIPLDTDARQTESGRGVGRGKFFRPGGAKRSSPPRPVSGTASFRPSKFYGSAGGAAQAQAKPSNAANFRSAKFYGSRSGAEETAATAVAAAAPAPEAAAAVAPGTGGNRSLLADALSEYFGQSGETPPPMYTVDSDTLAEVIESGRLETTRKGAQPWSYSGIPRRGDFAIRLKRGSDRFVEFVPSNVTFGQTPRYYPRRVGVGTAQSYIPVEHLEYFDAGTREWLPLKR